ncbi:unnamed protein product [Vicia faba]|uniref:Uncharacterized protein n=1 Tax=Vicia faba TaxID=3906 RepID=A0AAV1B104_VICFA|nr:unnamed protein product [Vicia faba]
MSVTRFANRDFITTDLKLSLQSSSMLPSLSECSSILSQGFLRNFSKSTLGMVETMASWVASTNYDSELETSICRGKDYGVLNNFFLDDTAGFPMFHENLIQHWFIWVGVKRCFDGINLFSFVVVFSGLFPSKIGEDETGFVVVSRKKEWKRSLV